MRPVYAVLAAVVAVVAFVACAGDDSRMDDLETRLEAAEAYITQHKADCEAEQQAVLDRLSTHETPEDYDQDEVRSVCGQSLSADGADYTYADTSLMADRPEVGEDG